MIIVTGEEEVTTEKDIIITVEAATGIQNIIDFWN